METGNVWVLVERDAVSWREVSLELLGEANRLALALSGKVVALLVGSEFLSSAPALGEWGADKVYVLEHPLLESYRTDAYTGVLQGLVEREKPEILLMGATSLGRDLGPRLAARLKTGFVGECVDLRVSPSGHRFTRTSYGGNVFSTWTCSEARPVIVTVCPGVIGKRKLEKQKQAEIIELKVAVDSSSVRTRVIGFIPADPKTMDISDADVVVTCGRGLGSAEKLPLVQKLAELLGAVVGGSRPAVDEGWLSRERQVGLTGKTLSAKLVIAFGISGASQHTMGMKDCDVIIAVNTDRAAPIFKISDISVVTDMHKFLPCLTSQLENAEDSR